MIKLSKNQIELFKPLLGRYVLYGFGLADVLLLPKLISSNDYGQFEYLKNIVFLFPNALLGVYSGYTYFKYVKNVDTFNTIFKIGLIHTIIFSVIVSIIINNFLITIPLVIINLYTLIEQKLKVEKYFLTIFSFKPILSISIICCAFINTNSNGGNANRLLFQAFIISFFLWFILVRRANVSFKIKFKSIKMFEIKKYFFIIKKIISSVLVSIILSLFFFTERYFIEKYYPFFLNTYSFAFNLCQILIILISSLAYISTVTLGEQINNLVYSKVIKTLTNIILGYFLLFIFFIIGVFIISPYYKEFNYLPMNVAIISFIKGLYYAIGILTPILVYKDFNNHMFLGTLIIYIISFLLSKYLIMINVSYITLLILNNFCLIFYCFFVIYLLVKRVEYKQINI